MKSKLYWYKLETHFGPGHQSTEIRYFFAHGKLSKELEKEYAHEEAYSISSRYDTQAITEIEHIEKPPQKAIQEMRSYAEHQIANAQYTLDALKDL